MSDVRSDVDAERLLTGRDDAPDPGHWVHAGSAVALFQNGDLRTITVEGVEIVRRIYVAVRDLDWNTVAGTIDGLTVETTADSFSAHFTRRYSAAPIEFECEVDITGTPDGAIEYRMNGRALSAFPYAKIGLCIHHPIDGFAGGHYEGTTPNGAIDGTLPSDIGPQIHLDDDTDLPLFDPVSWLTLHHTSGGVVTFTLAGDLWEMEDQRNWSDASYKSASTPASLGYHHEAVPGTRVDQSISVSGNGFPAVAMPGQHDQGPVRLRLGHEAGPAVPAIGLGIPAGTDSVDDRVIALLTSLAPAHLRLDLSADAFDEPALDAAAALAAKTDSSLEVALMLSGGESVDAELAAAATHLLARADVIERIIVFARDEESTSRETFDRAQAALSGIHAQVVSGTNLYFNELNRHRIPPGDADGLAWSLNPQIHAFDELSIIENLQAQPDTVATAQHFAPGTALFVTPITLRPRFNAVAVTENQSEASVSPTDPRQGSLFAAAWTLGSIAALAPSGVAGLTYYETIGPRGVADSAPAESPPAIDSRAVGDAQPPGLSPFPVAAVIADACSLRGARLLTVDGVDRARIAALAVDDAGTTKVLLANLTRDPVIVELAAADGSEAAVRILDDQSWPEAAELPSFLAARTRQIVSSGSVSVTLRPYATARVEMEQ